jgi:deazaflavin-dependent oxidoreductase (nitroreductase family)
MIELQSSGRWHSTMKRVGSLWPVIWLLSHTLHHLDRLVLRLSNGRYATLTWFTGLPFLILTTTGARSGQLRAVPLIGIPHGRQIILIASNWGKPHPPAWYFNLRANSIVEITVGGETAVYTAHEAYGAEYETCWRQAVSCYPGYDVYKRRAGRHIPAIVLTAQEEMKALILSV